MKKIALLATAGVFAATLAASANAEEVIKPLDIKKPVAAAKSTQALPPPVSLGLGGLGAGASTAVIIGGIVTTIVVIQATSGT